MLKRIFLGFVWFIAIHVVSMSIGGAVAGGIAGGQASKLARSVAESSKLGYEAGRAAGLKFRQENGTIVLIGSILLAVAGTYFGVLPGTKKKEEL